MNIRAIVTSAFLVSGLLLPAAVASSKPGWLGLGIIVQRGSARTAPSWIYVQRIAPNSPAARAGIRPQDIITAIDGESVRFANTAEALAHFSNLAPGMVIAFSILRQHQNLVVRVRAVELPEQYRGVWEQGRRGSMAATQSLITQSPLNIASAYGRGAADAEGEDVVAHPHPSFDSGSLGA